MSHQLVLPGFAPAPAPDAPIDAYLASRRRCGPRTLALYRHVLTRFERWRAGRALSPMLVEAYLASYATRAQDTQHNIYRVLKTYCRWLHARGLCATDPFAGPAPVEPPRRTRQRRRTYTDAEVVALLRASGPAAGDRPRWAVGGPRAREQPQARVLVLLLIDSALRAEEVCRLTCAQARSDALIVVGKGGHEDRVFVTEATRAALAALAGSRPDADPLFRAWRGGACSVAALRGIVARLARRAGVDLPPRPVHAFRHYAAQGWAADGVPDLVIKRLMRHASLETTRIYTDGARDEAIAAVHARVSPIGRLVGAAEATNR